MATVKRAGGRVETMGSHVGLDTGEQNDSDSRIKARDAEVANRNNRIIENGAKSVKKIQDL